MRLLLILGALFALGCSVESDRSYPRDRPSYEDCTCPEHPGHYVQNMGFTDHTGRERSFPIELSWGTELPIGIYATKGVSGDSISYYYSEDMPERRDNGLIKIKQVDGPLVHVEYKDIEVTMIPVHPLPLDPTSEEIVKRTKEYKEHRRHKCPYHKRELELDFDLPR